MVKKIDIKTLDSFIKLKELIEQIKCNQSNQYLFTENGKIVALLVPPTYFNILMEKDVQDTVAELRKKDQDKQKVLEFIRELREYNKDADSEEIQADIDAAVKVVQKKEVKHLQTDVEIPKVEHSEKITKKLNALRAASGTLNDLTSEQMETFETAIKRRPLFK